MTTDTKKTFDEITETFGLVPSWMKQLPDVAVSPLWATMRDFYLAETVIPNKYKELIGIAVSGATRCKYCVLFHTQAARLHGATDLEIAEASTMGAFTMLASTFVNAQGIDFEEFQRETFAIVKHVKRKMQQQQSAGDGKNRGGRPAHA